MSVRQAEGNCQVGAWLTDDVPLNGADIGESRRVSSADVKHPVKAHPVS